MHDGTIPALIIVAALLVYAYLDLRYERICRRAVDDWNSGRDPARGDDPFKAQMY